MYVANELGPLSRSAGSAADLLVRHTTCGLLFDGWLIVGWRKRGLKWDIVVRCGVLRVESKFLKL